jgi:hypothetical protein
MENFSSYHPMLRNTNLIWSMIISSNPQRCSGLRVGNFGYINRTRDGLGGRTTQKTVVDDLSSTTGIAGIAVLCRHDQKQVNKLTEPLAPYSIYAILYDCTVRFPFML